MSWNVVLAVNSVSVGVSASVPMLSTPPTQPGVDVGPFTSGVVPAARAGAPVAVPVGAAQPVPLYGVVMVSVPTGIPASMSCVSVQDEPVWAQAPEAAAVSLKT